MRAVKTCAMIILAAIVAATAAALPKRTAFECGTSYTFFVGRDSADCRAVTVDLGAQIVRLALADVCGESTVFDRLDIDGFLSEVNGEIVFCEELSDSVNYYCTADLPYSVELYGREINLHICVRDDGVAVGSPIIFGGY